MLLFFYNKIFNYFDIVLLLMLMGTYFFYRSMKLAKLNKIEFLFVEKKNVIDGFLMENYSDDFLEQKDEMDFFMFVNSTDAMCNSLYFTSLVEEYEGYAVDRKHNVLIKPINNDDDVNVNVNFNIRDYFFQLPIRSELLDMLDLNLKDDTYSFITINFALDAKLYYASDYVLNRLFSKKNDVIMFFLYNTGFYDICRDDKSEKRENSIVLFDFLVVVKKYNEKKYMSFICRQLNEMCFFFDVNIIGNGAEFFYRYLFASKYYDCFYFDKCYHKEHYVAFFDLDDELLDFYVLGYVLSKMKGFGYLTMFEHELLSEREYKKWMKRKKRSYLTRLHTCFLFKETIGDQFNRLQLDY